MAALLLLLLLLQLWELNFLARRAGLALEINGTPVQPLLTALALILLLLVATAGF